MKAADPQYSDLEPAMHLIIGLEAQVSDPPLQSRSATGTQGKRVHLRPVSDSRFHKSGTNEKQHGTRDERREQLHSSEKGSLMKKNQPTYFSDDSWWNESKSEGEETGQSSSTKDSSEFFWTSEFRNAISSHGTRPIGI